jgi:HlyD family secretion protein
MNHPAPHPVVTGAAMDSVAPKRGHKKLRLAAIAGAVLACALLVWHFLPHGLQVQAADARVAAVQRGTFVDDVSVRANAEALSSVMLDSVESGRVEEVIARDGAKVQKGDLLFRLSNPQRNLDLLARQSDYAQQVSNLASLRGAFEQSRTEHQRRLSENEFNVAQAVKAHERTRRLHAQGFISNVALEESADKLEQQKRLLAEAKNAQTAEMSIKRDALERMERTLGTLQDGLKLVNATVDALAVRAPIAGRLTDFRLQVGETVKPDQRVGRIDDPSRFKLVALVDEFYLPRIAVGRAGKARIGEQLYPVEVSRVYPQIKEGRFTVEMVFTREQPAGLSPGQSMDAQLTLSEPTPALLLPNGSFVNDTGGAWAFVLARDGVTAERRAIRIGRRSTSQVEVLSGLKAGEQVVVSSYSPYGKATTIQLNK